MSGLFIVAGFVCALILAFGALTIGFLIGFIIGRQTEISLVDIWRKL
jgi:hypothetical protein